MEVYHGHPNTYTIKDSAGEPIIGRFYEQELSSAEGRQPDFKIEKILRKRMVKGKRMAFVKWWVIVTRLTVGYQLRTLSP
jgi:hypothetical protein